MYNFSSTVDELTEPGTMPCQNGWIFGTKDFDRTISSENLWICEKDFYATTVFTVVAAGMFVGNVVFGPLADKYGATRE
jgi:MFS family permease